MSRWTTRVDSRAVGFAVCLGLILFRTMCAGASAEFTTLRSFGFPELSTGANPSGPLLKGRDGAYYGTTPYGGLENHGTVFRLETNGTFTVLFNFTGTNGANPGGALVEGPDEALYGAAALNGRGLIFRLSKTGTFTVLRISSGAAGDLWGIGPLLSGADGALYGTCYGNSYQPGQTNHGTVFKLNPDGSGFAILHYFAGSGGDGRYPSGRLIEDTNGVLYGTTEAGGDGNCGYNGCGTVYKIGKDGGDYAVLQVFSNVTNGARSPQGGLLLGSDGLLYGTTKYGGSMAKGTVYCLERTGGSFAVLHSFLGRPDGDTPSGPLSEGSDGALYGATLTGGYANPGSAASQGTIFRLERDGTGYTNLLSFSAEVGCGAPQVSWLDNRVLGTAQTGGVYGNGTIFCFNVDDGGFTNLVHFNASGGDGQSPSDLVASGDGWLYGVAQRGGNQGSGVVFKMRASGTDYAVLHHFGGTNGGWPNRLIEGRDGTIYGTTEYASGTNRGCLFRLQKDGGGFQVLHWFPSFIGDGATPGAALLEGSDGHLYGVAGGGTQQYGIIYRLDKAGENYQVLRNFGRWDGSGPRVLLEDATGTLYGAAYSSTYGGGTVFRLSRDGSGFTNLIIFSAGTIFNQYNLTGLVEGAEDWLYFSSEAGGPATQGTVWRIRKNGADAWLLHNFAGDEGSKPRLTMTPNGLLYGIAQSSGTNEGVVFGMAPDGGNFTRPYVFTYQADGGGGGNCLVRGPNNVLYGTSLSGGALNYGRIFRLALPPASVINAPAVFGRPGMPAILQAACGGIEPMTWQWQFNNTNIPGATNLSWTLPVVTSQDCGYYRLISSNYLGSTTSSPMALALFSAQKSGTNLQLSLFGPPSSRYWFQCAPSLSNGMSWTELKYFTLVSNRYTWQETMTTQQFYQAVFLP